MPILTRHSAVSIVICLFAHLQGCTPSSPPSSVLAEVDSQRLTVEEFKAFSESIPDGMKQGKTSFERDLNLLESLIDKKLLLIEAGATRVEEDPWFKDRIAIQERSRLLELFRKQEINGKIEITEEEMQEHYRETDRDRALRFNGIMVKTLKEAEQILAELESGADFDQLAIQRSVHRETGALGGDTGEYSTIDELAPNIAAAIFPLQVGGITPPVIVPYQNTPHFCVFKIVDERPMPLAASRDAVLEELTKSKRIERIEILIDSLSAVYHPEIHEEALAELLRQCRAGSGSEILLEAPEIPIFTDDKRATSLGEFVETVGLLHVDRPALTDSAQVVFLLERVLIPERLFLLESGKLGLDEDPQLIAGLSRKRQELLLSALRRREVDQHIETTPEEARNFYDAYPEKFTPPPTTTVVEILVDSDSLALQLKQQLLQSEYPEELALEHSRRQEARHHAGRIPLTVYNKVFFEGIYEVAAGMAIGQIGGPVRTRRGYSVFKVVDRQQELTPYDAESQRRATAYVKIDKVRRSYVDYVRSLREKYQVEIFEENLRQL